MTTSISAPAPAVNPLPSRLRSFYAWLRRWHGQTGDVHASTAYFARKQGVTERTIYRWLRRLRDAGFIACEVIDGVERYIIPQRPLPPLPTRSVAVPKTPRLSGVRQADVSGVAEPLPVSSDAGETPPPPPVAEPEPKPAAPPDVVASLMQAGVSAPVAVQLAREAPEECRRQVRYLPQRRGLRDRAAALVAAIRGKWGIPTALLPKEPEYRRPVRYVQAPKPAQNDTQTGASDVEGQPTGGTGAEGKTEREKARERLAFLRFGGRASRG